MIRNSSSSTADGDAYTIREFCARHRLSMSMYYKMRTQGRGPREMHVGRHVVISREAAAKWRRAREADAGK